MQTMIAIAERRERFRAMHGSGCFVLPNPWDIGSARYLQQLGFKALATTSAGFAFSRGRPDYGLPIDQLLAHCRELAEATDLPINADFENGFADEPEAVAQNVRRCAETGVAALSIDDSTRDENAPLYERTLAIERVTAAAEALAGTGLMLVARTEEFLVGNESLDETLERLRAFAAAGADCLYAPGISTHEEVRAVVAAVAPKPVNVLVSGPGSFTVSELAALGVRRVSVGGALARAAWGGFMRAASELARDGTFGGFAEATPHGELNKLFAGD